MKTAYFSLGCFWSPQLEFEKIKGVKKAEVGYCGGDDPNTTYEKVCTGTTNHAEVVKVYYDESIISYKELLSFFFKIHDPTTLNRQGPNVGYQYRSEIFFNTEEERLSAEKVLNEANKELNGKIVTVIRKEKNYCKAEEYHQKYFEKRSKK